MLSLENVNKGHIAPVERGEQRQGRTALQHTHSWNPAPAQGHPLPPDKSGVPAGEDGQLAGVTAQT